MKWLSTSEVSVWTVKLSTLVIAIQAIWFESPGSNEQIRGLCVFILSASLIFNFEIARIKLLLLGEEGSEEPKE